MKSAVIHFLVVLFCTSLSLSVSFASSKKTSTRVHRTLTFDSGYLPNTYSTRALNQFGIELIEAISIPYDLLYQLTPIKKLKYLQTGLMVAPINSKVALNLVNL